MEAEAITKNPNLNLLKKNFIILNLILIYKYTKNIFFLYQ